MTAGVTGVFWLPRKALANSTMLHSGAHAVPISAAAGAWGTLAAAYAEATATMVRVMAEIGVGLQGVNGVAALAKLAGFTGWTETMAAEAAIVGTKAAANATAYGVAALVMPSPVEIAAVYAAKTAAYSTGGVVNGSAQAAEAAELAMDIRAALVMEAYEAATTVLATPTDFPPSPEIAKGAPSPDANLAAKGSTTLAGPADPVQAAAMAAGAFLQNPGVQAAATQAGQIAGTVASTGASAVSNVASAAVSAAAQSSTMSTMAGAGTMMGGAGVAGLGGALGSGGAGATRASSIGGFGGVGGGAGNVNVKLPEGWGGSGSVGGGAGSAAQEGWGQGNRMDAATRAAASSGAPYMPGTQRNAEEDEEHERKTPDYLKFEHFKDGRTVIPSVIGGTPGTEER